MKRKKYIFLCIYKNIYKTKIIAVKFDTNWSH